MPVWVKIATVLAFMSFWLFGMTTALASGGCRKGLSTAERTNKACLVSMTGLFGFKKIGQPDKASDAPLYAGYAIATLASGDASSARDLFRQSFHFGYASSESVELKNGLKVSAPLFTTVLRVHHDQTPPEARALWWEVFQEADADLFKELLTAIEAKQDDTGAQIYAEGVQYV